MCVPGCLATIRRRQLLGGAGLALAAGAASIVPPVSATLVVGGAKIKGATGGPRRAFALL